MPCIITAAVYQSQARAGAPDQPISLRRLALPIKALSFDAAPALRHLLRPQRRHRINSRRPPRRRHAGQQRHEDDRSAYRGVDNRVAR